MVLFRVIAAVGLVGTSAAAAPALAQAPGLPVSVEAGAHRAEVRETVDALARHVAEQVAGPGGRSRSGYDLLAGTWSEETPLRGAGDAIEALVAGWRLSDDPALLEAARRAGDWWIAAAFPDDHPMAGLPNPAAPPVGQDAAPQSEGPDAPEADATPARIHASNVLIGAHGLFVLARATGEDQYAAAGAAAAAWIVQNAFDHERGLVFELLDTATGAAWRTTPPDMPAAPPAALAHPGLGGHALRDACFAAQDAAVCWAFERAAGGALAAYDPETGPPIRHETDDAARLIAAMAVAESFLEAYATTGDAKFLEAAASEGARAARAQDQSGVVVGSAAATAHAGALWLRLRDHNRDAGVGDIMTAATWLSGRRYAADHPDANLAGAIGDWAPNGGGLTQPAAASTAALRFLSLYLRDLDGADLNYDEV